MPRQSSYPVASLPLTGGPGEYASGVQDGKTVQLRTASIAALTSPGSVSLEMFGGIGDGVIAKGATFAQNTIVSGTNNAQAWIAFGKYARSQAALGLAVTLNLNGVYLFDHSQCFGCLMGIPNLRIVGNGSTIQNTYNQSVSPPNFAFSEPFFPACNANLNPSPTISTSHFIQQTVPNSIAFTMVTAAEAGDLSVGQWVMIGSLDVQYFGSPINLQQFEYARVVAVNPSTGVVTLNQSIRYEHRTDFPDDGAGAGVARVWVLDYNITVGGQTFLAKWDIDHTYEDIVVGLPPGGGQGYATLTGRSIKTANWIGCGFSESIAEKVYHRAPILLLPGEPDKLVSSIVYDELDFFNNINNGHLGFQSPLDRVTIRNSKISNGFQTGPVKAMLIDECDIDTLGLGGNLGQGQTTIVRNSRITNIPFWGYQDGSTIVTIDGTSASFSNGIITLLKSSFPLGIGNWNVVPGSHVNLCTGGSSNIFTADWGGGYVISLTEDSTHVYIATTLGFSALPMWANGNMRIFRQLDVTFQDCWGCDVARTLSDACSAGYRYFEHYKMTFGGNYGSTHNINIGGGRYAGELISVVCRPRQLGAASNATATVSFNTYDPNNSFTADAFPGTQMVFAVGASPLVRTVTQNGFTNKQAGDSLAVGGVPQTALLQRVIFSTIGIFCVNADTSPYQAPVFDVEFTLNCGLARRFLTHNYDEASNPIASTQGLIQ